jgi:hypothetical protein
MRLAVSSRIASGFDRAVRVLYSASEPVGEMGEEAFESLLSQQDPGQFITTTTEDWGSGRGRQQGKRVGHMVTGAMADPPRGKKTYTDPFGKLNLTHDERVEVTPSGSYYIDIGRYLRDRAAGFDHHVSVVAATPKSEGGGYEGVVAFSGSPQHQLAKALGSNYTPIFDGGDHGTVKTPDGKRHDWVTQDGTNEISILPADPEPEAEEDLQMEPPPPDIYAADTRPKAVSVSQFREAMDTLRYAINNLHAAVGDKEIQYAAMYLKKVAAEVSTTESKRASERDVEKKQYLLRQANDLLQKRA